MSLPAPVIWPAEEISDIEELMRERFGVLLPENTALKFTGETKAAETRALLRLDFSNDGSRLEFEVILDREHSGVTEDEGECLVLDAIDCLAFDWLESDRSERFHGGWQKRAFLNVELNVRIERSFPGLEARADDLLRSDGESSGNQDA